MEISSTIRTGNIFVVMISIMDHHEMELHVKGAIQTTPGPFDAGTQLITSHHFREHTYILDYNLQRLEYLHQDFAARHPSLSFTDLGWTIGPGKTVMDLINSNERTSPRLLG
ncbi:hypothetical protein BGX28_001341 [Mortierella sp. GBA30]|nr:hypothetical protein BGX28_001341 [Mortierella sp. GBA30]